MDKTWSKKLKGPRGPKSHWSGQRIPGDQPLSDEAIRSLEAVLSMFSADLLGFTKQIFDHIEFQVDPVRNLCTLSFGKISGGGDKTVSHQALDKFWPDAGPFGAVSGSIVMVNDSVTGVVLAEGHTFMLRLERYKNVAASDGDNFSWKFDEV